MKVLLTGSSGHLGYATVRELEKENHDVVALARKSSNIEGLQGTRASIVYGDVLDKKSLVSAIAGCDVVIHQAAVYRVDDIDPDEILRPAVEGTRNILEAAHQAGIKRVVYTSSIASIGTTDSPEKILDGSHWRDTEESSPYIVAKTRSEKIAHELAREFDIELMVICPSGVMGQGDYRITPTHGLILGVLSGAVIVPEDVGGFNVVDVFDVARLHVQAMSRGVPFRRYLASGENMTWTEIRDLLVDILGRPLPPASAEGMELPGTYSYFSCADAENDFDYRPKSARRVLESALEWLESRGAC